MLTCAPGAGNRKLHRWLSEYSAADVGDFGGCCVCREWSGGRGDRPSDPVATINHDVAGFGSKERAEGVSDFFSFRDVFPEDDANIPLCAKNGGDLLGEVALAVRLPTKAGHEGLQEFNEALGHDRPRGQDQKSGHASSPPCSSGQNTRNLEETSAGTGGGCRIRPCEGESGFPWRAAAAARLAPSKPLDENERAPAAAVVALAAGGRQVVRRPEREAALLHEIVKGLGGKAEQV